MIKIYRLKTPQGENHFKNMSLIPVDEVFNNVGKKLNKKTAYQKMRTSLLLHKKLETEKAVVELIEVIEKPDKK